MKKGVPSDEELSKLADSIPHDWKRLGAALGLKEKYLNAIEMNKPNDVYERALAVLQKWKKRMGRKATYGRLAEALNDQLVRRPDLVKRYSRSNEIEDLEGKNVYLFIYFFRLTSAKFSDIRIPECGNVLLIVKFGTLGFEIRNTAQGIWNPTNVWNQESKFY